MPTKTKTFSQPTARMTGHWYSHQKEQVYFTVEADLPRSVSAEYIADRYVARYKKTGPEWTKWTILLSYSNIGISAQITLNNLAKPKIKEWLESDEYAPSRQRAIAKFIAREAISGVLDNARHLLLKYADEITTQARERLAQGIEHLAAGMELLERNDE